MASLHPVNEDNSASRVDSGRSVHSEREFPVTAWQPSANLS